jgi:hypothetical protein
VIFAYLLQTASTLPTDASALERAISALESAISALERAIKSLESSSVPWEHSLPWFTALVLVGVAMEWWVIRHEWRDDMEAWALVYAFGILRSPGRPSIGKLLVEAGSVLLIALGIMGELGAGLKIASINGVLRGKSAELRSKNAELRSKSWQLVALLEQETERLHSDNLILQRSLSELQERVQWRHITPKELPKLIRLLSSDPKGIVKIECVGTSEDACPFAQEIWQSLQDSHWPSVPIETVLGADNSIGQSLFVRDITHAPLFAKHVQQAFEAAGIELLGFPDPSMPGGDVIVKIGRKPTKLQPSPKKTKKAAK